MLRHRAASGDVGHAVPVRSDSPRCAPLRISFTARSWSGSVSVPGGPGIVHTLTHGAAATGLARSRPANRRADAGRGRVLTRGGAQGIRLRPDADGGGRWPRRWLGSGTSPGASRPSASARQEKGEMSCEKCSTMLDGNAAGGLLCEVFAFDATAARITCAGCGRMGPMGELRPLRHRAGRHPALPLMRWGRQYGVSRTPRGSGSTCGEVRQLSSRSP